MRAWRATPGHTFTPAVLPSTSSNSRHLPGHLTTPPTPVHCPCTPRDAVLGAGHQPRASLLAFCSPNLRHGLPVPARPRRPLSRPLVTFSLLNPTASFCSLELLALSSDFGTANHPSKAFSPLGLGTTLRPVSSSSSPSSVGSFSQSLNFGLSQSSVPGTLP